MFAFEGTTKTNINSCFTCGKIFVYKVSPKQTAVTAYCLSKQFLLFTFILQSSSHQDRGPCYSSATRPDCPHMAGRVCSAGGCYTDGTCSGTRYHTPYCTAPSQSRMTNHRQSSPVGALKTETQQ